MTLDTALMKLLKAAGVEEIDGPDIPIMISSGSLGLDLAFGGGLGRGRLTTLASPIPGYGKDTTVNLFCRTVTTALPGVMLNGGMVAIFDMERKQSKTWMARMGVDVSRVKIFKAASGEAMFFAIAKMIKTNAFDLIVVNTVSATGFNSQIEAISGDAMADSEEDDEGNKKKKGSGNGWNKKFIAVGASHWAFFRQMLENKLADSNTALLTLNHSSQVIGANVPTADTESGGFALPRWASVRARMQAPIITTYTDQTTGEVHDKLTMRYSILKNGFMTRRITGTTVTLLDGILQPMDDVTKFGKAFGVFTKQDGSPMGKGNGNWYFEGQLLGSKESAVQDYLAAHDDMYKKAYVQVSRLASGTSLPVDSELYAVEGHNEE